MISINFRIVLIFAVGKNEPTLVNLLLNLFLHGSAFVCPVAPLVAPLIVLPPPEFFVWGDRSTLLEPDTPILK